MLRRCLCRGYALTYSVQILFNFSHLYVQTLNALGADVVFCMRCLLRKSRRRYCLTISTVEMRLYSEIMRTDALQAEAMSKRCAGAVCKSSDCLHSLLPIGWHSRRPSLWTQGDEGHMVVRRRAGRHQGCGAGRGRGGSTRGDVCAVTQPCENF